jgi:hypothetical protein
MSDAPKLKARKGAKPALQALKELEDSQKTARPNDTGGLSQLFAQSANALVPGQAGHAERDTKTGDDPFRLEKTWVDPESQKNDRRTPVGDETVVKTKLNRTRAPAREKKQPKAIPPALLFVFGIAIGAILFSPSFRRVIFSTDTSQTITEAERAKWDEDVQFHMTKTGTQLNRERVKTQFENDLTAPDVGYTLKKVKEPDMMKGLPLASEEPPRVDSRRRAESVNPNYPDARTQYALDEERNIRDFESRANKAYTEEFIANAARAGYAVKIGSDGVARVVGKVPRRPSGHRVDDRIPDDVPDDTLDPSRHSLQKPGSSGSSR